MKMFFFSSYSFIHSGLSIARWARKVFEKCIKDSEKENKIENKKKHTQTHTDWVWRSTRRLAEQNFRFSFQTELVKKIKYIV